jgi:hypothetical protein
METLLLLLVILFFNYWHSKRLENHPLEGPDLWYEEWAHRPGSACTWPKRSPHEIWAQTLGAYCTWPPKDNEDGRSTPGQNIPFSPSTERRTTPL